MTSIQIAVPTRDEVLRAKEILFHVEAWDAVEVESDLRLKNLATEIIRGHILACTDHADHFTTIRADKACELLARIPPQYREGYSDLIYTRENLWEGVVDGFCRADTVEREQVYAQVLLDSPSWDSSQKSLTNVTNVFENIVRKGFAQCRDTMRLHRLLKLGTEKSNPTVIRKAWQTIGAIAPIEELLLAGTSFLKFVDMCERQSSIQ